MFYRVQRDLPLPILWPRGEEAEPGKLHAIELKIPSDNWEFLNRLAPQIRDWLSRDACRSGVDGDAASCAGRGAPTASHFRELRGLGG